MLLSLTLSLALAGQTGGDLEISHLADNIAGEVTSEHYVFAWGPAFEPDLDMVDSVMACLEDAFEYETDVLGFPPPRGAETYRLPVYVAGSGLTSDTILVDLDIPAAGGAAVENPHGPFDYMLIPAFVFDPAELGEDSLTLLCEEVLAHELFHMVQIALETWTSFDEYWLSEASAVWVAAQVAGADTIDFRYLNLVERPDIALDDNPWLALHKDAAGQASEEDIVRLYRIYAMGLLLEHVAANVADPALVVDWLMLDTDVRALDALGELTEPLGVTRDDIVVGFHEALVMAEFPFGPDYAAAAIAELGERGEILDDALLTGTLAAGESVSGPADDHRHGPVQRFGAHRYRLDVGSGEFRFDPTLTFDGDAMGTLETPTAWAISVCERLGETWTCEDHRTEPEPTTIALSSSVFEADDVVAMVIPLAERTREGETFSYLLALDVEEVDPGPDDIEGGCACDSQRTNVDVAPVLFAVLALGIRRRRRRRRGPSPLRAR